MKRVFITAVLVITATSSLASCRKKVAAAQQPPQPVAQAPADEEQPAPAAQRAPETTRVAEPAAHDHTADVATFADELRRLMKDAHFDYDRHTIRADAQQVLLGNAQALRDLFNKYPDVTATIEGHADARGSAEYNLGLGDRRATSAREFLVSLGIEPARIRLVSYGKERPQCSENSEECWQRNRRVHFSAE